MSKRRILLCNILPQAPAAARAHFRVPVRRMVLITVDRTLGTASVCHEHEIILREHNTFLHTVDLALERLGNLLVILDVENDIRYLGVKLEVNTGFLKVSLHRQNQRLILIVLREL